MRTTESSGSEGAIVAPDGADQGSVHGDAGRGGCDAPPVPGRSRGPRAAFAARRATRLPPINRPDDGHGGVWVFGMVTRSGCSGDAHGDALEAVHRLEALHVISRVVARHDDAVAAGQPAQPVKLPRMPAELCRMPNSASPSMLA
ncbi:MAG: hypothetical protein R2749_32225 [Acidimicrobiales bacterium]